MKALIKDTQIMQEPFIDWIDPIAFAVFDCYGYALCMDYTPCDDPQFEFFTREIDNPFKDRDEDPEKILIRLARQIL